MTYPVIAYLVNPMKPITYAIIAAFILGLGFGWLLTKHFTPPCPVIDVTATTDSIRVREASIDSILSADLIRQHILDSIDSLPNPHEREAKTLRLLPDRDIDAMGDSLWSVAQ